MKATATLITIIILLFAQGADALVPRATFSKPQRAEIRDCDRWDLLVVKFNEGTGIRLRQGKFISKTDTDIRELDDLMAVYSDVRVARIFQRPEEVYEMEKISGERNSGRQLADLNLYYAFGAKDRY